MSKRRIFETHGVTFSGENGDQLIGYCPFSERDDKFYVNQKTWLWDSKTGGVSGNVAKFLDLTAKRYAQKMTSGRRADLAADRKLPIEAFASRYTIGWDGKNYTFPVRDNQGTVVDIRMYRFGGRMISTAGASVGLYGAEQLKYEMSYPIYLCEGEWDAIAVQFMLIKAKQRGWAVGVPGANTLKDDWLPWFSGRTVHTLYDNDGPGESGEQIALRKLKSRVQRLTFVHWPNSLPVGFDGRDWVIAHDDMATACAKLHKLFQLTPRTSGLKPEKEVQATRATVTAASGSTGKATLTTETVPKTAWERAPKLSDVMATFRKWLHLKSTDGILVMLACVVTQSMDGPPVWVFLVGPPGSAKTAILASLNTYEGIYSTSSLTVHSLISGANFKENTDPSLIPKLNGKVMVVKDFTSIMAMRDADKDEIFGILRDAYDGRCGKVFGNGVERHYESRFTVLAAVTPRIYDLSSSHSALGERFLKFSVGDNLVHDSEEEIIARAIGNINSELKMNQEFQDVVVEFLTRTVDTSVIPSIPKAIERKIVALAMWGARMRGSVTRDNYKNDIMTSRPSAEIGSRLGIQLAKLAKGLAMVYGHAEVTMEEYRLLKKMMLDTIPQRNEDIFRHLLRMCPTVKQTTTAAQIALATRYPVATVQRLLQDMDVLDIVVKSGTNIRFQWTLSPYIRACATRAGLYQTEEELSRPTRVWVKRAPVSSTQKKS